MFVNKRARRAILGLLLLGLIGIPVSAVGDIFVVDSSEDGLDPVPEGSLRQAIEQANSLPGGDTIFIRVPEVVLVSQLNITEGLFIFGDAPNVQLRVADGVTSRVFAFHNPDSPVTEESLNLISIEIANASTTADATDLSSCSEQTGQGGAICSQGRLNLFDLTIRDSWTRGAGAAGGAIWAAGSSSVFQSTFESNQTVGPEAPGGALALLGQSNSCTNSRIIRNSTLGDFSPGGGMYARNALFGGGCEYVSNSTSGANSGGGGVYASQLITFINTAGLLFNGNSTAGTGSWGGAMLVNDVQLINSTVSENTVAGSSSNGSGLALVASTESADSGRLEIRSSTFFRNNGDAAVVINNGANSDFIGFEFDFLIASTVLDESMFEDPVDGVIEVESLRIEDNDDAPISLLIFDNFPFVPQSQSGPPELGPFTRPEFCEFTNGDSTSLCPGGHFPLPGSPLIDGSFSSRFGWDGRGRGYARRVGAASDIGAIETSPIIEYFLLFPGRRGNVISLSSSNAIQWVAPAGAECAQSGLPGTAWSGSLTADGNLNEVVVDMRNLDPQPTSFPAEFDLSLTCELDGQIQERIENLTVTPTISIDSFTLNESIDLVASSGETINSAQENTLRWQVFPDAPETVCSGSGLPGTAWDGGGKDALGEFVIPADTLAPGEYQVGLSCEFAGEVAEVDSLVIVETRSEVTLSAVELDTPIPGFRFVELTIENPSDQPALGLVLDASLFPKPIDNGGVFFGVKIANGFRRAPSCSVDIGEANTVRCDVAAIPPWICAIETLPNNAAIYPGQEGLGCSLAQLPPGAVASVVVQIEGAPDGGEFSLGATAGADNADAVSEFIGLREGGN